MPPRSSSSAIFTKPKTKKFTASPKAKQNLSTAMLEYLDKPKRPLSAYNVFYQEERKRILEEMGHKPKVDETEKVNTQGEHAMKTNTGPIKRMRGRPRGKNYKKKCPHRMIGFEDLTKCISKRWKLKKKEFNKTHGSMVEENRRRYKARMKAFKERKKLLQTSQADQNPTLDAKDASSFNMVEVKREQNRSKKISSIGGGDEMEPYNVHCHSEVLKNHVHGPYFERCAQESPHFNDHNQVAEAHDYPYHGRTLNGYDYDYPAESSAANNRFYNANEQPYINYATKFQCNYQSMSINHSECYAYETLNYHSNIERHTHERSYSNQVPRQHQDNSNGDWGNQNYFPHEPYLLSCTTPTNQYVSSHSDHFAHL